MSAAFCPLEVAKTTAHFALSAQKQVICPSFKRKKPFLAVYWRACFKLLNNPMKTKKLIVLALSISSLAALPSMAGAGVGIQINVPGPVVVTPAPAVTVEAVPDSYVWDGTEYVGVVGSQYYYLGPGNVWLTLDGPRVARFHDWERIHADWRIHAIRNDRFRHDAHGHDVPFHDIHDSHGGDHGHDGDHH
jgi:hypothetical protein